jgi:DUF1680 family protein
MRYKTIIDLSLSLVFLLSAHPATAQQRGLTDTSQSINAKMKSTPLSAVVWDNGFWGERFQVFSKTSVQSMWETWQSDEGKGFNNFLIASGEKQGDHHGPPFHDGDMYKWLEGVAAVYAVTKDPELDKIMDRFIGCVVKSQRADGYIHTPVIIAENNRRKQTMSSTGNDQTVVGTAVGTKDDGAFVNRLNFETYNLGHLITAGIVHKRATGKTTLFNAAVKAGEFLYNFCKNAPEELAGNAICPSHYMAIAELYRETGDPKYLELQKKFIDIRGMVKEGTDDNQDRIPFYEQYQAMGHAVRANYLYAGVADLFLESGESRLMDNLTSIWEDIVTRKMYITGGCGALYDGTSPDGTDYQPANIQKVHQSFGRPYQLPHSTAHNETCANIGNMLFNWRMLQATCDGKYADLMETCFYNSILSGISLDGEKYFYTNPMRISDELPYTLRWPKERKKYISCFCCPPNTLRTLCETQDYAYSTGKQAIYVNLYGSNHLSLKLDDIGDIKLTQTSDYPWDGHVRIVLEQLKGKKSFTLWLRIPGWCKHYRIKHNGELVASTAEKGYVGINAQWKKGDIVEMEMDIPTRIVEANPLVEESRGQVAIQRGPIVYCAESSDLGGIDIDHVVIPVNSQWSAIETNIGNHRLMALEGEVIVRESDSWKGTLYRDVTNTNQRKTIRLIPYYAWGNRGKSEMTVWMPAGY